MIKKVFVLMLFVLLLSAGLLYGAHDPEKEKLNPEGDPKRGEALFKTPMLLGTIPISCASCHTNGMGLEKAFGKKEFSIFGKKVGRIEAAIDFMIVNILRGEGVRYDSQEMKDIKAFLKSLSTRPRSLCRGQSLWSG
jgi:mono/diheme cytochrome c family protein